jgi:hypothetical protein
MPQGMKKGASQSSAQSSEGFTISGKDVAEVGSADTQIT